nr:hypothetical protein [Tanacetum cinerariifolium]
YCQWELSPSSGNALCIYSQQNKEGIIADIDADKDVTLEEVAVKDAEDEDYARQLKVEHNKNINWDDMIEQVKEKGKQDNAVLRYQALKRKPQTEAHTRKNMIVYLKNMAGFKMDYFKGMSYDDIRLIFEKYFNLNVAFLEKPKEQLEEEESRALKRKTKSSEEQRVKMQKLDEKVDAVEDFKENMLRDYCCWLKTYCCLCKLKLLDDAADIKLRLLEQSAAVVQIVSAVQIVKTASIRVNTVS